MMSPKHTPTGLDETAAEAERTVSPFELFRAVWRRRFLVALITVLCTSVAILLAVRSPKEYSSSASLLFRDPGFARTLYGNDLFDPGADPQRAAQTNVDVVASSSVAVQARQILGTQEPVESLLKSITVTPSSRSDVATVEATRSNPHDAAAVANAFAQGYIRYRRETDRRTVASAQDLVRQSLQTAQGTEREGLLNSLRQLDVLRTLQTGNAEVIANATPDSNPTAPKPRRNAIFGLLVGLIFGSGFALLLNFLDRRLTTADEIEEAYSRYPVVATVPQTRRDVMGPELSGRVGEAYRMLREGLRFLDPQHNIACLVVTSAEESEGKSTVARHLATSLAAVGQEVVLVEADMRRPTSGKKLGVVRHARGLSDLLASGERSIDLLVTPFGSDFPLEMLPSGTIPPNPADLLRTPRAGEILGELRNISQMVIVDAPPLLPVADTRVLLQLPQVDGVIMVARVGTTRRDHVREAERVLDQSGRRVLGLVITGDPDFVTSSYYGETSANGSAPGRRLRSLIGTRS